jgi:helicase MOV-10
MPRLRARPTGWIVCHAHFTEAGCPNGGACTLRHDAIKCSCGALVLRQSITPHRAGQKHQKFVVQQEQQQKAIGPVAALAEPVAPVPEEDKLEKCQRCRRVIFAVEMAAHVAAHERQDKVQQMKEELAIAEENKEGVVVDMKDGVDFGVVPLGEAKGETISMRRTEKGAVNLVSASLRSSSNTSGSRDPPASP